MTGSAAAEVIDPVNLARATADESEAREKGFALEGQLLYALGHAVNTTGHKMSRMSRTAHEAMPFFGPVADHVTALIETEERRDVRADLGDLEMTPDGAIRTRGKGGSGLRLTRNAWRQLITRAEFPAGASAYLPACPPDMRAPQVDHWLRIATGTRAVLRTRLDSNRNREIYSVVSPKYQIADAPALAAAMKDAIPSGQGARGSMLYDGQTFELAASYHSDIHPTAYVTGEIFRAQVKLRTRDDGTGSARVIAAIERNLCENVIILDCSEQEESATHLTRNLGAHVAGMLARAQRKIGGFAAQWSTAARDRILDGAAGGWDPAPVFHALVDQDLVCAAGVDGDTLVARMVAAYRREPGPMRSDLINAITRAAHENEWSNPWITSEIETQAGALLYNWNVRTGD